MWSDSLELKLEAAYVAESRDGSHKTQASISMEKRASAPKEYGSKIWDQVRSEVVGYVTSRIARLTTGRLTVFTTAA